MIQVWGGGSPPWYPPLCGIGFGPPLPPLWDWVGLGWGLISIELNALQRENGYVAQLRSSESDTVALSR